MIKNIGNNIIEIDKKALSQHIQLNKLYIYFTIIHFKIFQLQHISTLYNMLCAIQAVRRRSQFIELGPSSYIIYVIFENLH